MASLRGRARRFWLRLFFRLFRWGLRAGAVFILLTLLPVVLFRWVDPPTTAFILRYRYLAKAPARQPIRHRWVDLDRISRYVPLAVVAAEDQKFPQHFGFDFESLSDAVENRLQGDRLRGASTITQQTAKNLFLWPGRSFFRKALEAWFTALLELCWPKARIMEVYLNAAEFGRGVFGVGAAAGHFFAKPAAKLNAFEAAVLAAVLPSPKRMHAGRPSAYVRRRARWILDQMQMLGPGYLGVIYPS
jgi:monofunctional biosynthetic peptidoglycan transglycosylase